MMTEEEYRKYPAINQSLLGKIAVSPKGLDVEKEEKDYFTLGSLVDCKLTDPDNYNNKYYVVTADVPSDAMVAYCKELVKTGKDDLAWLASGLKSDPKVPAKSSVDGLSKFDKEASAYYKDLLNSVGKQAITFDEEMLATQISEILKTNEFTSKYFERNSNNMFQVAIVFKYYSKECKALLDIIHINHENKTIRPMDLKTTGKSVFSFMRAYLDYKYYIQAAFYTMAVKYSMEHGDLQEYKDYKVLPFQFIVQETNMVNPPHIFEVDGGDMEVAEEGGIIEGTTREIRGFKSLIEDLEYHQDTGQWEYRREVYENSGIIPLKAFVKSS